MGEIEQVTAVAKGVTDYGLMAMMAAFYLLISMGMMIAVFKWFRSIINQILADNKSGLKDLLQETREQNDKLNDISDGLRTETQLRIRNLSGFAFDLSVEKVCRIIKRVREENHIVDHEATARKIRKLLSVIHEERKNRFDPFIYRGKPLSEYCNKEWIEEVANVVEAEIYNEDGANNGRAYTNVKLAYDNIKTDFYQRLNS